MIDWARSPRTIRRAALAICGAAVVLGCSRDQPAAPPTSIADITSGVPLGWSGVPTPVFVVGTDHSQHHGGNAAAIIQAFGWSSGKSFRMEQNFAADAYRGKRVRWSGWVRYDNVTGSDVGLYLSVEAPHQYTGVDDMSNRSLSGTSDWRQISSVLDVPPNALGITVGVVMAGGGTLVVDDLRLDVVGTDVPTTNTNTKPVPTYDDSAAVAAAYRLTGYAPTNLDFEGFPAPAQSTIDWLAGVATPITSTDPNSSSADLQPLKGIVGNVHVVGLGEGTHGTREFFLMKHRMLEMLVQEMGFTTFAMEASAPEANDLNRYVLTGQGDPKLLLSRLRFWTWNTQEVLDMIQWMRAWNARAAADQRVQFLGFDLQYPGESMDSVQAFATRVHSSDSAFVAVRFNCMNPYRNHEYQPGLSWSFYASTVSDDDKAACAKGLQEVYDLIAADRTKYPSAAPADTFELRLHDARLVQQFERMIATVNVTANQMRDRYMAENVEWIRTHAAWNGKVVLWAHDGHINAVPQFMGGYLRSMYGADYVAVGFLFAQGNFNAVGLNGEGLKEWRTTLVPANSIEAVFAGTKKPALLFDTHSIASGGAAAAPLAGPIQMRSIGAGFSTGADAGFFGPVTFPSTFDVLVYLQSTTASTLLPRIGP